MSTVALWKLFHRPDRIVGHDHTSLLAVIALASATGIFLTVLGGVHGFLWRASPDHTVGCLLRSNFCMPGAQVDKDLQMFAQTYLTLAIIACVLLLVPFATLAGSAARLAVSRRDLRLSALRLAGATNGQVVKLTAFDATLQAIIGSLIGLVGYMATMPAIMLLDFQNRHFNFQELWVGAPALMMVVAAVALLSLVSSLSTLRRVAITPLGVSKRTSPPLPRAWRFAIFMAVPLVFMAIVRNKPLFGQILGLHDLGDLPVYAVLFVFIAGCLALMNLLGVWVITARAKAKVRHPRNVGDLIAMRRILDNPKRAWRNVSGIALAVFIAGLTSISGYCGNALRGNSKADLMDPGIIMLKDIGTGGLLTLVFAAVLAAVSSGVMQAGNVYDQVNEYRMLVLEGTDVGTLNRARFTEVLMPLKTVVAVAGLCSMTLMLPLFPEAMTEPATIVYFLLGVAACFCLVSVGACASNAVASNLNLVDYREDD